MMRLENESVRIELDARTGGFRSIYDKGRDYEYIAAPERALLWRLMTPDADMPCKHLDGAGAEVSLDGNCASITYCVEGVEVKAALTLEGDALLAELTVTNHGPRNVEEVMFPWVRGVGPVPEGRFIWPNFWRRRYDDVFGKDFGGDHHTWNEWTQKQDARYPSHLTSAWCDYGNEEHGLGIEGRHTDFSIMDFEVHKIVEKTFDPVRRTLDFVTVHPRRIRPGETYRSSPVRISLHDGDWHAVAGAHREWLETWIQKPDRPDRFAKAMGWHFYFMKHQDGWVRNTYDDLPKMAGAALEAGCPYLLVFGWQQGGHDNHYFYRYVPNADWGGEEALKRAVAKCREMGVEIMPFYNGTLANVETPEHKDFGHRWEAKTREGHAYYAGDWARHNFDACTRNRAMLHTEIAFCEEQRAYFLETVKRIVQDYGFGNTQLDQISEKMFVDYDEDHVTTTPDRVYVDGLLALLPEVRRLVREANPEGVVISECLNEFTGQWCDSSWDWTILFPFPEPILYTLPWLMASHEIDALEYGEANRAFAYKMHLDMKIDGGDAPISKYPQFAAHVKALADLRERAADYCVFADFRDQEGVETDAPENVVVKVYVNQEQSKAGIVLAETAGKEAEATLTITWESVEGTAHVESSAAGATEEIALTTELQVKLDAHEVRVLCIDLAAE